MSKNLNLIMEKYGISLTSTQMDIMTETNGEISMGWSSPGLQGPRRY